MQIAPVLHSGVEVVVDGEALLVVLAHALAVGHVVDGVRGSDAPGGVLVAQVAERSTF